MDYKVFLSFFLIILGCLSVRAQECECTIKQVENNTVESCQLTIGDVINVSTTSELRNAINLANSEGGNKTILIADGIYPIASTSSYPYITASNVVFRSASGNRDAVVLTGQGMKDVAPGTEIGISCVGDNITIADLTIKEVGNHAISMSGNHVFIHNVKIQDSYEQMVKGTSADEGSDNSIVQCSLFEYTEGVGPQYYIGGLDIHDGDNWIIRDNIFKNIASPSGSLAEHAIHFWDFSSNNLVERNSIVNCDRGIGFGLGSSPNEGGIIRNNMIYNDGSSLFHDVGIGLETSPNTKVYNNTVFIAYPNAIEYRFSETTEVDITNNLTNRGITSRSGGEAVLTSNYTNAEASWFENIEEGNLRILPSISDVIDQGSQLEDVIMDIDQTLRPQGEGYDIGASEYKTSVGVNDQLVSTVNISVSPNPANSSFVLKSDQYGQHSLSIYSPYGQIVKSFENVNLTRGIEVNTEEWESGLYFGRVVGEEKKGSIFRLMVVR